jgi:hypothetical protein
MKGEKPDLALPEGTVTFLTDIKGQRWSSSHL